MGQRHQFYVIAKVGSRYRLLAAAHHQWLYRAAAVNQCLLILKTLCSPGNLSNVRRELIKAETVDWDKDIWFDDKKKMATDSLFPFIATSLLISSTVNEYGGHWGQTMLLPLNTHFLELPNDDGISIYDITEPEKPRYGFMFLADPPHPNRLIDAVDYIKGYSTYMIAIQDLKEYRNVTIDSLRSTWPKDRFQSKIVEHSAADHVPDIGKLSLKEQSLSRLLDAAFESEDLDWVPEAEQLPEFLPALKHRLFANPKLASSTRGPDLLGRALVGEASVDLIQFKPSPLQVHAILRTAWGGQASVFRSLSLPDMEALNIDHLTNIIQSFTPAALSIGDTPQVSLESLLRLISGSSVTQFTCSALYKRSVDMACRWSHKLMLLPAANFPLGRGTGFPIAQMIFLQHYHTSDARSPSRLKEGGVKWSALTSANEVWNRRDKSNTLALPLPFRDALVTPERTPHLLKMTEFLCKASPRDTGGLSIGNMVMSLAKQFAAAGETVQPIPGEMLIDYRTYFSSTAEHPPRSLKLAAGQWTLLVMYEADVIGSDEPAIRRPRSIRYSFVTLDEDGELVSKDATGFSRAVLAGSEQRLLGTVRDWRHAQKHLQQSLQIGARRVKLESSSVEEVKEALAYVDGYDAKIGAFIEKDKEELEAGRRRWQQD